LQMLVFAGVLGCFEQLLVLPATLSAKSAIPDNKSYQEWHLMSNVTGHVALRINDYLKLRHQALLSGLSASWPVRRSSG